MFAGLSKNEIRQTVIYNPKTGTLFFAASTGAGLVKLYKFI
jgi:hypothetical protein